MKNKGFTLIEVLAVITLLAIISMIAVPIVVKTINEGKKGAFLDKANMIYEAAEQYYLENEFEGNLLPLLITYNKGNMTTNKNQKLSYSGSHPTSGNVCISTNNTVTMKVYDSNTNKCAVKTAEDKTPHLEEISEDECKLTTKCN